MKKIVQFHSAILILCSSIGFVGHFLQFGVWRITPWIPASIGVLLWLLANLNHKRIARYLSVLTILAFGILVTSMCTKFWSQDFQSLRKQLIFSMMSLSSWISFVLIIIRRKSL